MGPGYRGEVPDHSLDVGQVMGQSLGARHPFHPLFPPWFGEWLALLTRRASWQCHPKAHCGAFPILYGLREACAPTQVCGAEMRRTSSLDAFNRN